MRKELTTESPNPESENLDCMTTVELVRVINTQDRRVANAVGQQTAEIARAIDIIAAGLADGGRLVYVGAGTSGRLGVLDAAECPPTFNADPEQVIGLIAGGPTALLQPVEGAEDSAESGANDLDAVQLSAKDTVVGIAASGATPYVLGALQRARELGAATIGFSCNSDAPIVDHSDVAITVVVGPEVLAGSTRMKAGTATKMVLNMLTTGAMVRLGKTYGNLMVDLQASNEKLLRRSVWLVQKLTGLPDTQAEKLLQHCDGEVKTAIASHRLGLDASEARERVRQADGRLRAALQDND